LLPGTLYQWFYDAALRHSDSTAIEIRGESISYRQLVDLVDPDGGPDS
jgi:hypothetical protein